MANLLLAELAKAAEAINYKLFLIIDLYQSRTDSGYLKGSSTTVILKDLIFLYSDVWN